MTHHAYEFRFDPALSMDDLRGTLRLSVLAAEAIYGETVIAIDAPHHLDGKNRLCRIDGTTAAGRDLVRLFAAFARREFGPDAIRLERRSHARRAPSRDVRD